MQTAFEYISAGIILCAILGLTGQFATNMVTDRVYRITQSNGLGLADKMIDSLLLSTGSPVDWGHLVDSPVAIGLAGDNAMKPYQLDRTKVLRLYNGSEGYIPPYEVRNLMGLSPNVYISLQIYPMYSISVQQIMAQKFIITVRNQWGITVPSVNVTGAFTDMEHVNATQIHSLIYGNLDEPTRTNTTTVLGTCNLSFPSAGQTLIIMANQLDVKSVTIWPALSSDLVGSIDSDMGTSAGFNTEVAYRSVEIDGMNYYCKLVLWWS